MIFLFPENTHALHMGQGQGKAHNLQLQLCIILVVKVDFVWNPKKVRLIVLLMQVKTKQNKQNKTGGVLNRGVFLSFMWSQGILLTLAGGSAKVPVF